MLFHSLKKLRKIQQRAALWIMGAFHTSPICEVEAITGLIPIHFHLDKLSGRHQLRAVSLPKNHTLNSLLDDQYSKKAIFY